MDVSKIIYSNEEKKNVDCKVKNAIICIYIYEHIEILFGTSSFTLDVKLMALFEYTKIISSHFIFSILYNV